ncbi:MAG: WD40/YVTN/BNR-like repeat-containing protein, partial [Chitinophagales bacterium]
MGTQSTSNYQIMRFILLSLLLLLTTFAFNPEVQAQKIDIKKQLKGMKMRSIGPAGMSGRVTSIDVDLNNPNTIFIGTASGGVWKSESGGIRWKPIFDDQPLQSIGAVAVDQTSTGIIWAGTGEGNPRNSLNTGKGIYKSLDGGKNWKLMGLEKTKLIHRILIHPTNSDIVYVAALGSAWGENPERGVYKTTDGGTTWNKILSVDAKTGCADLVIDPSNPNKLLAAMWEFGRKPWTFNSGGKGSGLYITFDGGKTWKKQTDKDGLPKGNLGRIGLAIAPSNPKTIYALVEAKKNALYKSTDGGFKWSKIGSKNVGNRPFYYADIFVDPQNENRIYSLHSVVTKSEDGGKTFETLIPYSKVHPDYHAFWVNPSNPKHLMIGNDGGMAISQDRGENWRFVENLPLAQFYHINYDMDLPYHVYGGMQDNGSWIGPAYAWKSGGIRNSDWQELVFGDGFDVVPRPD